MIHFDTRLWLGLCPFAQLQLILFFLIRVAQPITENAKVVLSFPFENHFFEGRRLNIAFRNNCRDFWWLIP